MASESKKDAESPCVGIGHRPACRYAASCNRDYVRSDSRDFYSRKLVQKERQGV